MGSTGRGLEVGVGEGGKLCNIWSGLERSKELWRINRGLDRNKETGEYL